VTRAWWCTATAALCCPLTALIVLVAVASAQTPFDPQSLVGEWQGQWTTFRSLWLGRGFAESGHYYLTVQSVVGNKVHLRVLAVTKKPRDEREYEGELDGNVLTYGGRGNQLTIDGATMKGWSRTLKDGADIELTKISR
jgi:hypothetical protein